MNQKDAVAGSGPSRSIERGGTYGHEKHGYVEVTGIWHGTKWVKTAPIRDEHDTVIIRFTPDGGDWSDELAATLKEFRESIN